MFKRAMKASLESAFTHKERSEETPVITEQSPLDPLSIINKTFPKEAPETTISASVSIEGTLNFERFIRIDGSFIGDLLGQGRLHIGPTGRITADLNLESAVIEGFLEGNIHVAGHLEIKGTATVKGDITAKTLTVEPGATISGNALIN